MTQTIRTKNNISCEVFVANNQRTNKLGIWQGPIFLAFFLKTLKHPEKFNQTTNVVETKTTYGLW